MKPKPVERRDGQLRIPGPVLRQTHTYAILDVAVQTFADIRARLVALGPDYLNEYLQRDVSGRELIVFGTVALAVEKSEISNLKSQIPDPPSHISRPRHKIEITLRPDELLNVVVPCSEPLIIKKDETIMASMPGWLRRLRALNERDEK